MTVGTNLELNRQNQQATANTNAAQPINLPSNQVDNTPSVLSMNDWVERMTAAKNAMPNITPPSEDEIQHQMWMSSGLMALVATLVTGNAAGGIAAGMTAALAVHDHGYDLRQRGEYVMELHEKGYSNPAILNWYETGDNKELDKERDQMDKLASEEINREEREADRNQRKTFHDDDYKQRGEHYSAMERKGDGLGKSDHSGGMRGIPLANYITTNGVMPDGSLPTAELADWAGRTVNAQAPGRKISLSSPDPKANMTNKQALQSFQRYYKTANDAVTKTAQAEARLNSLDPSTPIGQLAMEFQFLTVEAPTIGNDVAKAAGVSDEAVHGWADKINQIEQEANRNGSLTPQMVKELKDAAHAEFQAIKDLQQNAAKAMADKFDLSDPTTAAMVLGATGVGGGKQPDNKKDYSNMWGG